MPHDPHAELDLAVLDMIEHSPIGAVPNTPAYQDALRRLYGAHQVYASADHKGGHVTARSLATREHFLAANLDAFAAGTIDSGALEPNADIFSRYVRSLPAALQNHAEAHRAKVAVNPPHHRAKAVVVHDPVHTIFFVPGTGPHHGLPGNYLHGALIEAGPTGQPGAWAVHLRDCDDGLAVSEAATPAAAVAALHEALECAPFHLEELEALGFRLV